MDCGLTLCMIVKNEALNLPGCLDSVKDLACQLLVVDTGSSDGTAHIAANYGADVVPFDFTTVDFAAARNYSIGRARGRWLLVLDADERLDQAGVRAIGDLIQGHENVGYFLERHNRQRAGLEATIDYVVRLFPNRPEYRYRGRVHETINASIGAGGGRLQKTDIRIDHNFSSGSEERRCKNRRYVEILKEEIAADPSDDSRLDFLAAEYHQLEMFDEATAIAERLALLRPHDPRAHLFAGVYHLLYKPDLRRAREDFNHALRLRPGYPEAESFLRSLEERESESQLPIHD